MENDYFKQIRLYLSKTRIWDIAFNSEDVYCLIFTAENQNEEKMFLVAYADEHHKPNTYDVRPLNHHYYMSFEQENVSMRGGNLGTVYESGWYRTEEDILYRIKQLMNRRYK